jgi:CelD/BcsL family acetyltransferase involved in cellulose biosynthesis
MSTVRLSLRTVAPEVTSVTDLEGFRSLEREWNGLVTACNDSIFLRHEYLRVWTESFAANAPLRVLTGRSPDGHLVAALPLLRRRGSLHGVPVQEITALANHHSCRFDMVAEDPAAAGQAFFRHLSDQDDWDVLRITDVPDGGQAWHVYQAAQAAGFPVGVWESQRSPYLVMPSGPPSPTGVPNEGEPSGRAISPRQRSNARRRMRQMKMKGAVRFECLQPADLLSGLQDFFDVEHSSWKGRNGTACDQDEQTRAFYTRLAEVAAERNWLSIFRLILDDRTVAVHYGLTYDSSYLLPKVAFREEFSELSPGLVLMNEVIDACASRNVTSIDFLGGDDEWKLRWSSTVVPHYWLYIFRNNFKGRMLHKMKFNWGPWAKHILKRTGNVGELNEDA